MQGIRIAVTDGAAHAVDSSELAFKLACLYAFRDAYNKAKPVILEPIMNVEVFAPPPPSPSPHPLSPIFGRCLSCGTDGLHPSPFLREISWLHIL